MFFQSLLMYPLLMPSFWRVTAAIDWICIIRYDDVTVLDGMNLFRVHDQTSRPIAIRKDSTEQVQQPVINIYLIRIIAIIRIMYIIDINVVICLIRIMFIIVTNLLERVRRIAMSDGVFADVVWRNSLYQLRRTLVTPISSSDGSITGDPR